MERKRFVSLNLVRTRLTRSPILLALVSFIFFVGCGRTESASSEEAGGPRKDISRPLLKKICGTKIKNFKTDQHDYSGCIVPDTGLLQVERSYLSKTSNAPISLGERAGNLILGQPVIGLNAQILNYAFSDFEFNTDCYLTKSYSFNKVLVFALEKATGKVLFITKSHFNATNPPEIKAAQGTFTSIESFKIKNNVCKRQNS